jgi:phosphomannomutase
MTIVAEPIISVSGLRGIVGESLTPEIAVRYAAAFASTLTSGPILLTYDGRESGPIFMSAISEGLSRRGRDVFKAGVAATPTTGVLVKQWKSQGGIQISASHNPPEYNGLKLLSAAGRVIPVLAGEQVMKQYRAADAPSPPDRHEGRTGSMISLEGHAELGKIGVLTSVGGSHTQLVSALVNIDRLRKRRFHVLLDCNHGAGGLVGRLVLGGLGCMFMTIGALANGQFEHPPEPTADNLAGVLPNVVMKKCDIGFCQDPDADRLAVIDERGRYIGEEYTLAICVNHVLRQRPGPVVTNCSTSRMTEDVAKKYNVPFFRSAVGEANVVDAMLEHGAVIGGEGNGGVIDPRVVLVRDSFTAMALILDAMAERDLPVSALADELPRYEICKTKIELPQEKLMAGLAALERQFNDAKIDKLDGIRFDWPDSWLLVRPSNTEPIVRAIAEAPTTTAAKSLCQQATAALSAA